MRDEVVIALLIVLVITSAGAGYFVGSSSQRTTVTDTFAQTVIVSSTVSRSSCNYVLPGPCVAGYNFTLSINYSGPWSLKFQGYNSLCEAIACLSATETSSGSYNSSGNDSRIITVPGSDNGWTLCAQAHKLDASYSTLTLQITGQNETSLPFGSAATCSEAQFV
jgi:hypothetical protein